LTGGRGPLCFGWPKGRAPAVLRPGKSQARYLPGALTDEWGDERDGARCRPLRARFQVTVAACDGARSLVSYLLKPNLS
jgi:hypothetical protein